MSILVSAVLVITLTLVTLGRALLLAAEGETKKAGQGADYIRTLAMDAEARTMFLGIHFGLFRSFDGGRSWKMVSFPTRQPHLDILTISPDPKTNKGTMTGDLTMRDRQIRKSKGIPPALT